MEVNQNGTACVIVKVIDSPDVQGSSNSVGHVRKIKSYEVETNFYKSIAKQFNAQGCRVPHPLLSEYERQSPGKCSATIVMEDLRERFPVRGGLTLLQAKAAASWLARMHAISWGKRLEIIEQLWPEGCYWRLDTRKDELASMHASDHSWVRRLARAAPAIADKLRSPSSPEAFCSGAGWTLVHGDFKAANMVFSTSPPQTNNDNEGGVGIFSGFCPTGSLADSSKRSGATHPGPFFAEQFAFSDEASEGDLEDGLPKCAVYDFQYCGGGFCARDLAQLVCIGLNMPGADFEAFMDAETDLLEHYHSRLCAILEWDPMSVDPEACPLTFRDLSRLYELCLLDFARFQGGWGFWGNSSTYTIPRAQALLETLDFGKDHLTIDDYRVAINRQYPC
jgi:hypothetical protein